MLIILYERRGGNVSSEGKENHIRRQNDVEIEVLLGVNPGDLTKREAEVIGEVNSEDGGKETHCSIPVEY